MEPSRASRSVCRRPPRPSRVPPIGSQPDHGRSFTTFRLGSFSPGSASASPDVEQTWKRQQEDWDQEVCLRRPCSAEPPTGHRSKCHTQRDVLTELLPVPSGVCAPARPAVCLVYISCVELCSGASSCGEVIVIRFPVVFAAKAARVRRSFLCFNVNTSRMVAFEGLAPGLFIFLQYVCVL